MLNLSQVQAFLAVIENGGFQGAAHALGLAQPTVSHQLRKLEDVVAIDRAPEAAAQKSKEESGDKKEPGK